MKVTDFIILDDEQRRLKRRKMRRNTHRELEFTQEHEGMREMRQKSVESS